MNHYRAENMEIDLFGFYRIGLVLGLWFWRKVGGIRALEKDGAILYYDHENECLILNGTSEQMQDVADTFGIKFKRHGQRQQEAFLGWFYG